MSLSAVGLPSLAVVTFVGYFDWLLSRSIKYERDFRAEKQKCRLGEMTLELP